MGRVRRKKQTSWGDGGPSGQRSSEGSQRKLSPSMGYSHISKSDIIEYALPIIKEIGKALYPPAAVPIEILYQLYTHADSIREASSAISKGDYVEASKIVMKEAVKEAAEKGLGIAETPVTDSASTALAKNIGEQAMQSQEKQIESRVVQGTVKGMADAVNKKIVDKATDGGNS